MKTIFTFLILITFSLYSQPGRQNYQQSIFFLTPQIGWFSSYFDNAIYKTTDGGKNWIKQNLPVKTFHIIKFADDTLGFMSAPEHDLKTIDQGRTWKIVSYNEAPWDIFFRNKSIGYILTHYEYGSAPWVGSKILKTLDGGTTWDTIYKLPYSYITGMWIHNNDDITLYGGKYWDSNYGGLIARTTDSIYYDFPPGFVCNVTFTDSLRGFAKKDSTEGFYKSGIEKTTDGGRSWFHDTLEFGGDMFFTDSLNGFAIVPSFYTGTGYSSIAKTTDAGYTWEFLNDFTPSCSIWYLYFVDNKNGIIISYPDYPNNTNNTNQVTYRTEDGGYTWLKVNPVSNLTKDFNPITYSLSQNYPNPFNPSTTIKYTLRNRSFVSLEVYDVLGNKISSLVKEDKAPGEYQVQWNANKFSSGIYFYRLKVNDFIQTRKMLLLK